MRAEPGGLPVSAGTPGTHSLLLSQHTVSGSSRPASLNPSAKMKKAVTAAVITFDYLQNRVEAGSGGQNTRRNEEKEG